MIDTDGDPGCLDYIWVAGRARVESSGVVFDRPAVGDPTLLPSDHFGLSARLVVGQ
jgi:endonuclease/exonuclease/phosphatase family metal-dependent hydrolase